MSNLLEQAVDSLLEGLEGMYLDDDLEEFTSSVLSTSATSSKFRFKEFSASFEKANAYLGLLLSSHS